MEEEALREYYRVGKSQYTVIGGKQVVPKSFYFTSATLSEKAALFILQYSKRKLLWTRC